jgi:hypothetical protein
VTVPAPLAAYNITVADTETFFVAGSDSAAAVWVHNCDKSKAKAGAARPPSSGDWAKLSGNLRAAAKGKGNFNIGRANRAQADTMGRAWVGKGHKVASDGKTLISKDGLRQYRPPAAKSSRLAKTGVQANFERREKPSGNWTHNGHLDIDP